MACEYVLGPREDTWFSLKHLYITFYTCHKDHETYVLIYHFLYINAIIIHEAYNLSLDPLKIEPCMADDAVNG